MADHQPRAHKWDVGKLMKIIDREVDARERSVTSRSPNHSSLPKKPLPSSCTVVTDTNARKEALCKSGRSYVCLRKGHISRDCRSTGCCNKCRGRHNTVCPRKNESTGNPSVMLPGPVTEVRKVQVKHLEVLTEPLMSHILTHNHHIYMYNYVENHCV